MDQIQYHKQSLTRSIASLFLKRATQYLLLSVSVFSFFFHSKFHFFTFSLQILSQTMDKNFIFLLFNGILVLLAKTSGFINLSQPTSDSNRGLLKKTEDTGNDLNIQNDISFEKTGQLGDCPIEGESEDSNLVCEDDKEEEAPNRLLDNTSGVIAVIETQESEKELDSVVFFIEEEEEQEEEEGEAATEEEEEEGLLSADELNKKFDEFIRRTKEGIRIEAQQQLMIMAY